MTKIGPLWLLPKSDGLERSALASPLSLSDAPSYPVVRIPLNAVTLSLFPQNLFIVPPHPRDQPSKIEFSTTNILAGHMIACVPFGTIHFIVVDGSYCSYYYSVTPNPLCFYQHMQGQLQSSIYPR